MIKSKVLLVTGGTGGHVIPAVNFANFLLSKNINCKIILDKRGIKYMHNYKGTYAIINSSNLNGNLFLKVIGLINLIIGFIQSFFIIIKFRPKITISFGSYASFTPITNCLILKSFLKTKIFIHEQNSIVGRTNNLFSNFADIILLNFNTKSNIKKKYQNKTFVVGSPENHLFDIENNLEKKLNDLFTVLIIGGSQGSEYIAKFGTKLIKDLNKDKLIKAKFYFQCPPKSIVKVSNDLSKLDYNIVIKDYYDNIEEILQKSSLVVSRAGAGLINDIIKYNIPSILVPLPSSKDNHQFYNAKILSNYDACLLIDEEKDEYYKAKMYVYEVYDNNNKVQLIKNRIQNIKVKNSNFLIYKLMFNEN